MMTVQAAFKFFSEGLSVRGGFGEVSGGTVLLSSTHAAGFGTPVGGRLGEGGSERKWRFGSTASCVGKVFLGM